MKCRNALWPAWMLVRGVLRAGIRWRRVRPKQPQASDHVVMALVGAAGVPAGAVRHASPGRSRSAACSSACSTRQALLRRPASFDQR